MQAWDCNLVGSLKQLRDWEGTRACLPLVSQKIANGRCPSVQLCRNDEHHHCSTVMGTVSGRIDGAEHCQPSVCASDEFECRKERSFDIISPLRSFAKNHTVGEVWSEFREGDLRREEADGEQEQDHSPVGSSSNQMESNTRLNTCKR